MTQQKKGRLIPKYSATVPASIPSILKQDLHGLIDDVHAGDPAAISRAVDFTVAESFGYWHNRARAKLCRWFKNHRPNQDQQQRLVEAIATRLTRGDFSEQFKDQLSMAVRFDPELMRRTATSLLDADKEYIRRYARWTRRKIRLSRQAGGEQHS